MKVLNNTFIILSRNKMILKTIWINSVLINTFKIIIVRKQVFRTLKKYSECFEIWPQS